MKLRKLTTLRWQLIVVSHADNFYFTPAVHCDWSCVMQDNFPPAVHCGLSCVMQDDNFTPAIHCSQLCVTHTDHTSSLLWSVMCYASWQLYTTSLLQLDTCNVSWQLTHMHKYTRTYTHTHTHMDKQVYTHTHTHTHTQTTHKHTPTNACTQPHKQEHTVRAFCTTLFTRKLYMWQQNLAVDERSLDHRNTLHQAGDETVFKQPPYKHMTMVSDSWLTIPLPVVKTLLASLHAP